MSTNFAWAIQVLTIGMSYAAVMLIGIALFSWAIKPFVLKTIEVVLSKV